MSTKALPAPGTYASPVVTLSGQPVVYEADSGAICLALPIALNNGEVNWSGRHTETMVLKDGELRQKSIANLKKIFNWDGLDFFALEDVDISTVEFEIADCHHESYTPKPTEDDPNPEPRDTFKIGWLNPIGGSSRMPDRADDNLRKKLQTKFGAKLKAISGGAAKAPAKKVAPATPVEEDDSNGELIPAKPAKGKPAPPSRSAAPAPPSRKSTAAVARTSSEGEVWNAYVAANGGDDADTTALGKSFYEAIDEIAEAAGVANDALTPKLWGQVADKLEV